jgi:hypothetical protein
LKQFFAPCIVPWTKSFDDLAGTQATMQSSGGALSAPV